MTIERDTNNFDREARLTEWPQNPRRENEGFHERGYRLPDPVYESLTPTERELKTTLERLVRRVSYLYDDQLGTDEKQQFYPQDVTKKELRESARTNSQLLSNFTVVTRDEDGKLLPVEIHEYFSHKIHEHDFFRLLEESAILAGGTGDLKFQEYLESLASAFTNGNWEEAVKLWLKRGAEAKFDLVLWPGDTNTDKFMGTKFAWQGWAGVIDREKSTSTKPLVGLVEDWLREDCEMEIPEIEVVFLDNFHIGGQAENEGWTGNSMPPLAEWAKDSHRRVVIFNTIYNQRKDDRIDAYRRYILPERRMGTPDDLVIKANERDLIFHEIGHALVPDDIKSRLQQYADPIEEAYCESFAGRVYSGIHIADLTTREREAGAAAIFSNGFLELDAFTNEGKREMYFMASTMILDYCLQKGSINISEGGFIEWDDPRAVLADITECNLDLEKIATSGTISQAEEFIKNHFKPNLFPFIKTQRSRIVMGDDEISQIDGHISA